MSFPPKATLSSGDEIPLLGFGTFLSNKGVVGNAVDVALRTGYTHIDCAAVYDNEKEIGEVFGKTFGDGGALKRGDVWVTSKLWNTKHHPEKVRGACEQTLKDLQLEYLDLYLVHWPTAFKPSEDGSSITDADGKIVTEDIPIEDTWAAMEALVDAGLVKNIGVSNFGVAQIEELLSKCRIRPTVNQVEVHPYFRQEELVKFCQSENIHVTAYSPFGNPSLHAQSGKPSVLDLDLVKGIAEKHQSTPAAVVLRWGMARGISVIPKSVTPERIISNFEETKKLELSSEEVAEFSAVDTQVRFCDPRSFWKVDVFGEGM